MYSVVMYRLYPNTEQKEYLAQNFGACRKIWNLILADTESTYKSTGKAKFKNYTAYLDEYSYLSQADSTALSWERQTVIRAFKNFWENPQHFHHPKYKIKKGTQSYTTFGPARVLHPLGDNFVKLPKISKIKAKPCAPLPNGKLKRVTVSRNSAREYYASCLFEMPDARLSPLVFAKESVKAIGLDYKSDGFFVDSNGKCLGSPKYYRQSEDKIAWEQHKLSKKKKGSHNYQKQKVRVAKVCNHVKNQRKDFLEKLSTSLVKTYDIICVEDLNMQAIAKYRGKLGKSTYDNGYAMFISMLERKASQHNCVVIKVDKFFPSSQLCSSCGYKNSEVKNLSVREWDCPKCHTHHDRDVNAAINILNEGLRIAEVKKIIV